MLEDNPGIHIARGDVALPEECLKGHLIRVGWGGEGGVNWDGQGWHAGDVVIVRHTASTWAVG